MENEKTLVICDSEPIAVEGVRYLVDGINGVRVLAEEMSLAAGIETVSRLRPAMVLMDKAFGIHPVMDWVRRLREEQDGAACIVWSGSLSEAEGLRFVQAGASGVLRKTAPLPMVRDCIRAVAEGGTWMEDALRREAEKSLRRVRPSLTSRELQVMELVEQGLKNKEIAGLLGICTGTVKIHLKHIFEKTGIRGRYGLALSGLKEKGLLAASAEQTM